MGVAAYNRGNKAIREQFNREARHANFYVLESLNSIDNETSPKPFGDVHFAQGNGGWWATCPRTGYGFHYRTLRQAIGSWRVSVTQIFIKNGELIYLGVPK